MERFNCRNSNCLECVDVDREVGCLNLNAEGFAAFQELMVFSAKHILNTFDEGKRFFLNFLLEITPHCDCVGIIQPSVVQDLGVLGSHDIVAIEQASLDLIGQAGFIEGTIPPYFKHVNLDSNVDLHPFARLWGSWKNPYLVTEFGEQHGLGSRNYDLVEILSPDETAKMRSPKHMYERQPSFS